MTAQAVLGSRDEWTGGGHASAVGGAGSIFWRQDGDAQGAPVTLLHGFPTSSHDWAPTVRSLTSAGFHVTTLDLLGFGASAKPTGHRFSIMEQASVVEALWEQRDIGSTAVAAHDYSVTVTQELLTRNPERIVCLTFLNGGVYPELHRPIAVQRLLHSPLGPVLGRFSSERMFSVAMRKITSKPLAAEDLHALWVGVIAEGGQRIQHELLRYIDERKLHAERWTTAMETFAGPTQFIWGPDDPISGAHVLDRLRQRMPHARFDALDGVGHYPQIEDPSAVAAPLIDFLSAHAKGD